MRSWLWCLVFLVALFGLLVLAYVVDGFRGLIVVLSLAVARSLVFTLRRVADGATQIWRSR